MGDRQQVEQRQTGDEIDPLVVGGAGQQVDNRAAVEGQSQELRGQPPAGGQTAAEGQSAELATQDPTLDRPRKLLEDIQNARYVADWTVAIEMESLMERSDGPAQALLAELRTATRQKQIFWKSGTIKRGKEVVDAHKTGQDALDPRYPRLTSYIIEAERFAKVAGDPEMTALARDLDALSSFYIRVSIYGENLPKFAGYIRQMKRFIEAGQPVDHQQYWETKFWLPEIFGNVLQPNLSNPLFKDSAALGRFLQVQNDFLALEAQMKGLGGDNPYAHTTRGKTKAELMAIDAPTPTYEAPGDREQQRAEFDDTIKRADEILAGKNNPMPGDIHGIIQRLQMMRDHGPYSWSAEDVDRRLGPLRQLFDQSQDPEAVRAQNASSTERMAVDIDPKRPMSVHALGKVLRTLANEPGEKGAFKFSLAAEISNGWAYAKGWAELEFFFTVTDAMTCVLGFDASAAVGAGLNLGGLVKAGVEVGGGYSMKARFKTPEDVAAWIIGQMAAINRGLRRAIFPIVGGDEAPRGPKPVALSEGRVFGGAQAGVDAGVASASIEGQAQATHTTYSQDGQQITTGTAYEKSLSVGATVNFTPAVSASGSYTFKAQNVVRDMNTTNEGEYHNHAIEVGIGLSKVLSSTTTTVRERLPPKKIQDGVLAFFSAIEGQLPAGMLGGVPLDKLHGAFDVVVAKLYESVEIGRKAKGGLDVNVSFEWNNVKENGTYRNQYFRIAVTPKLSYGRERTQGEDRKTGASISASKSEVVYESVGSETYSHVFQRYVFAWDRAQWDAFVADQKGNIEALIHNMATEGRPAFDAEFARMLSERTQFPEGRFEDWLPVLEAFFETKRDGAIRGPDRS